MMFSLKLGKNKKKKKVPKGDSELFGSEASVDDKVSLTQYNYADEREKEKPKKRKIELATAESETIALKRAKNNIGDDSIVQELEALPEKVEDKEYEEMPVEEFGAAMLRGMGWTDENELEGSKSHSKKLPHEQIHPEGLGIGAKSQEMSNPVSVKDLVNDFMPVKKVPKQ